MGHPGTTRSDITPRRAKVKGGGQGWPPYTVKIKREDKIWGAERATLTKYEQAQEIHSVDFGEICSD
jgi:hypothetical protein